MERAIESVKEREGDVQVKLEYKPFLVDPTLSTDRAITRVRWKCQPLRAAMSDNLTAVQQQHLKARLGVQKADAFQGMIQSRGEEVGIDL